MPSTESFLQSLLPLSHFILSINKILKDSELGGWAYCGIAAPIVLYRYLTFCYRMPGLRAPQRKLAKPEEVVLI